MRPYCRVGGATEPFGRRYDLITCIEVLEHMSPEQAQGAIANICAHADGVLFSSSPFDYAEVTHFNVQPPEYWARLFAQQGFFRHVDVDAGFLTPWAVYFRRQDKPLAQIVGDYERSFWQMRQESHARVQVSLEQREQLAQQEARLQELGQQLAQAQGGLPLAAELAQRRKCCAARPTCHHREQCRGPGAARPAVARARLAPSGTRRDKAVEQILRLFVHNTQ